MRTGWDREADQVILDGGPARLPVQRRAWPRRSPACRVRRSGAGRTSSIPGPSATRRMQGWRSLSRDRGPQHGRDRRASARPCLAGLSAGSAARAPGSSAGNSDATLDFAEGEHHAYGGSSRPGRPSPDGVPGKSGLLRHRGRPDGHGRASRSSRFQFAPMPVTLGRQWVSGPVGHPEGALLLHAFSTVALEGGDPRGRARAAAGLGRGRLWRSRPAPMLVYSLIARCRSAS